MVNKRNHPSDRLDLSGEGEITFAECNHSFVVVFKTFTFRGWREKTDCDQWAAGSSNEVVLK